MTNSILNLINILKEDRVNNNNSKNNFSNITKSQGEFLSELVSIYKPKSILEIGTSNGYSTLWLLLSLKSNSNLNSKITTVEINENRFKIAKENFSKVDENKQIISINDDVMKFLDNNHEKFDFIFLDANQENYTNIIEKIIEKKVLCDDFVIVCDNMLTHNMDSFNSFMEKHFETHLVKVGSGFLVGF
jgi:predicted O-methyltransferase YrrM